MSSSTLVSLLALGAASAAPTRLVHSAVGAVCSAEDNPCVTLNNGVEMPVMALGTWQYNDTVAADAIGKGLEAGFTHIDTAFDYYNQEGVGKAVSGLPRSSFFLTTKTQPCVHLTEKECFDQATKEFLDDLSQLGLDYVDLILLHGPSHRGQGSCDAGICARDLGQWNAYEKLYKAGKARAIGVSNYCVSCFDCLLGDSDLGIVPAVNQVEYHVGMGSDPESLVTFCESHGIVVQAYSPLGDGSLISDPLLANIGSTLSPPRTAAQVALKWIVQQGHAVATKADSSEYLDEDIGLFNWNLTASQMTQLSAAQSPTGTPSWACSA